MSESARRKKTICLCMIVKNEAHLIRQTLQHLSKYIRFDYWAINDNGSTDGTQDLIRNYFSEAGIPGVLDETPWKDFAFNRTVAFRLAYGKTDYAFVWDADDEISGDFQIPETLTSDSYMCTYGNETGSRYSRCQLFNNRLRWKYVAVLHEYPTTDEPGSPELSQGRIEGDYYFISGRTGARNRDPDKYLKDALILEKAFHEAVEAKDSMMCRYAFYTAQSYKSCNRPEKAIEFYKKVLTLDNWSQEKYIACLEIYDLYTSLKREEEGLHYLVESFRYDGRRVEGIYQLIKYYCVHGLNEVAMSYYSLIQKYYEDEYATDNIATRLFAKKDEYDFYLPYYMVIVSERLKRFDVFKKMYESIFRQGYVHAGAWWVRNLFHNLQFRIPEADPGFVEAMLTYLDALRRNGVTLNPEQNNIVDRVVRATFPEQCTKKEDSKKILFYCGFSTTPWNHTTMNEKGVGGSETCVANLAKHFPSEYEIYVCGGVAEEKIHNVTYVDFKNLPDLLKTTSFYATIVSRYIGFLDDYPYLSTHKLFVWVHDLDFIPYKWGGSVSISDVLQKWNPKIDRYICLTEWHSNHMKAMYPFIADKVTIIPNGINSSLFLPNSEKKKNRFVFTSCPERGYARVLELWPEIEKIVPDAELKLATYVVFPRNEDEEKQMKYIQESANIEFLGCLKPTELYELIGSAEYWLYPTNFHETFCITALEMLHSKVICLYYPVAALQNTVGEYGVVVSRGSELESITSISNDNMKKEALKEKGIEYARTFDWPNVYTYWSELIFNNKTRVSHLENKEKCKHSKKILFWTGFSYRPWNYSTMVEKGLGGAETCVANITSQFPDDYEIYVCGGVTEEKRRNVTYVGFDALPDLIKNTHFYAVIISRYVGFLEDYSYFSAHKLFVWIHEDHILPWAWGKQISVQDVLTKWHPKINNYICLTEWHKNKIQEKYPYIADKLIIIPNGVRSSLFPLSSVKTKNRFLFTSPPERGYARLLELWPEISKRLPDAELKLATYDPCFPKNEEEKEQMKIIQNTPTIEFLGSLNPTQLYTWMSSAEYWLYPVHANEAFCITAVEMLHSKVVCLYYPIAALNNTIGDYGIPVTKGTEIDAIMFINQNTEQKQRMMDRGLEYARTFDWPNVYKKWARVLDIDDYVHRKDPSLVVSEIVPPDS